MGEKFLQVQVKSPMPLPETFRNLRWVDGMPKNAIARRTLVSDHSRCGENGTEILLGRGRMSGRMSLMKLSSIEMCEYIGCWALGSRSCHQSTYPIQRRKSLRHSSKHSKRVKTPFPKYTLSKGKMLAQAPCRLVGVGNPACFLSKEGKAKSGEDNKSNGRNFLGKR